MKIKMENLKTKLDCIYELTYLTNILSNLKEKGVHLFIATECETKKNIDHPFISYTDSNPGQLIKLRDLFSDLRNLFTYTDAEGNEKLRYFGAEKSTNDEENDTKILQDPSYDGNSYRNKNGKKKEWAKYKAYFIQQLKQQLGKDAKILFLDDEKTNTDEAKKVGVATVTANQNTSSETSI